MNRKEFIEQYFKQLDIKKYYTKSMIEENFLDYYLENQFDCLENEILVSAEFHEQLEKLTNIN